MRRRSTEYLEKKYVAAQERVLNRRTLLFENLSEYNAARIMSGLNVCRPAQDYVFFAYKTR